MPQNKVNPPLVNPTLIRELSPVFVKSYATSTSWGNILSMARLLPGVRGIWTYSSIDENNRVYDYSEQGRVLVPGTAYPNYDYHGLTPYANFERASSEYLKRTSEPGLEITDELSIMTWSYFDNESTANNVGLLGRWLESGFEPLDVSYLLHKDSSNKITFSINPDGWLANTVSIDDGGFNYTINHWIFSAGVFVPSTRLSLFVNGNWYENTTDIPASIYGGSALFVAGRYNQSNYLDGRLSLSVICAKALSYSMIQAFYSHARPMYMSYRLSYGSSSSSSSSSSSTSSSSTTSSSSSTPP